MEYFGFSEVGASGINADSYYISKDGKVFVISDGASGAFDKVGAGIICTSTVKEREYSLADLNPVEYVSMCIREANNNLIKKSQEDGDLSFGTMTMAVVNQGRIALGAVGDTPAYLIRSNTISKVIKPRKRYAKLIELGILKEEEINKAISSLPNVMWSMFDNFLPMVIPEIAIEEYPVAHGDILIICTDGVADWIEDEEFVSVLRNAFTFEEGCKTLLSIVNDRCQKNKLDDKTIIVAGF